MARIEVIRGDRLFGGPYDHCRSVAGLYNEQPVSVLAIGGAVVPLGFPMNTFSGFLIARHRWLLATALLIAAICYVPANRLAFDRSIDQMFAHDDPLLPPYRRLQQRFGGNEVVLLVYDDSRLLASDGSGLQRLARTSRACAAVPGVRAVLSLAEVNRVLEEVARVPSLFSSRKRPPVVLDPAPSLGAAYRRMFTGITHGSDGRTVAVACLLEPVSSASAPRREILVELRKIASKLPQAVLVGEPVMVEDGFDLVEADGRRLAWGTTTLLALTMIILFRNLRWMLIPLAVVGWSLVTTRAVLYWSRMEITMVSSMLTAIITVIAVATSIHFLVRFRAMRQEGHSPEDALRRTVALLLAPVAWACLTDAVGFLSLRWARVGPVHDFGIMMSLGATMVLVGSLLIIPGMALVGGWARDPAWAPGEARLGQGLSRLLTAVERHRWRWLTLTLALVSVAAWGTRRLEVETDFTRNFRSDSPIVRGYDRAERRLGGAGVWDAMIPAPAELDQAYVDRVLQWERNLRQLQVSIDGRASARLTQVVSYADLLAATEKSRLLSWLPMPLQAAQMAGRMKQVVSTMWWRDRDHDRSMLRVLLRSKERLPARAKLELIAAVEQQTKAAFGDLEHGEFQAEVTGFYVLLANLIHSLLRDQWLCFAIATSGIVLMMTIAFRSWKLALVALVPNLLPIFLLLGLMGHLEIRMNMGAAMIAAVSIGLSVDSSIHYGISFLRARRAGAGRRQALEAAQQTVGRALVFATLALVLGFSSLCTSQFIPTVYFGGLVSLAMLGGLAGNLIVLPLLIEVARA